MYAGDLAGAERTYLEAIDMDIALLGEDHPEVAAARENLGNVYFRRGQLDKTATNLEVVLAMRRKALGDDSEPVARTLANIGTVYKSAGNHEAAVKNYREAVERLSAKLGPDHPDVGTTLLGMGDSLRKLEKYSEAEAALKRSLDIHVTSLGEGNAATQRLLKVLVSLYTAVEEARGGGGVHGEAEGGRGRAACHNGEVDAALSRHGGLLFRRFTIALGWAFSVNPLLPLARSGRDLSDGGRDYKHRVAGRWMTPSAVTRQREDAGRAIGRSGG